MPESVTLTLDRLKSNPSSKVHLVGVGGSGMSGLARLLMQLGYRVSGSDLHNSRVIESLVEMGMEFIHGHHAKSVGNAGLVVYSSAIGEDNPERMDADHRGIPCARRAQCLAALSVQKEPLVIAGMHGKTTTSSMLAFVLRSSGWKCAHYIGAEIPILGASAALDDGEHFVIEADESDGTLTLFKPRHSLILNIEEEHLDYYGKLEEILKVFRQFIEQTTGTVVYCADDKNAWLLCSHRSNTASYGFAPQSVYRATEVRVQSFSSQFQVYKRGHLLGNVVLNVPGIHNVSNALGVIALATEIGVPFDSVVAALAEFRGANRRFEVRFSSPQWMIVDDYAHHPTEIKATLAAARNGGWSRVVCLFQPHRYSRTKFLFDDFVTAFSDADRLFVTNIYAASEEAIDGVSGESLVSAIAASGHPGAEFVSDLQSLRRRVAAELKPGDLLLTLGAGNIHQVATLLARELCWYEELLSLLSPETKLLRQEPMSKHTTLRVGGPAQLWCEPASEVDLVKVLRYAHQHAIPLTVIGRGSNVLVRDGGISGICLHLGHPAFSEIKENGMSLNIGAGARLKTISSEARRLGIGGMEFLEGIPGNLGGALRMNAGAMQGWTWDLVERIRCVDFQGNWHEIARENVEVEYRSVPFLRNHIAISAVLRGSSADPVEIGKRLESMNAKRWESQPAAPSAGCMFKNPQGIPAGKLIDELGMKNRSNGGARVSEVHGNFIVNDGGATAQDVLTLAEKIKAEARAQRGVELEMEVIVLGDDV